MNSLDKKFLFELLSCPTAPFRESHVVRTIRAFLETEKIAYFRDPIGNLVVGAESKEHYLEKVEASRAEPLRLFIAHMDHPGFHGEKWLDKKTLAVNWLGGTPRKFLNGARVWINTPSGDCGQGVIKKAKLNSHGTALETSCVEIKQWSTDLSESPVDAKEIFGGFSFRSPVWESKGMIYTKAADDLVGVFAILSLAKQFKRKNLPFLGLLSRAEEVGFVGTIGHLELGWLEPNQHSVMVVSLETSRTLPGALIGKGPIVRLGDRATPFDPGGVQILTEIAQKKLPGKFQRRIMDGGTCEATAALVFGFKAIGISVPLGNYHNQSFEGGPDSRGEWGPSPEHVHWEDLQGMMVLCEGLMASGLKWQDPWSMKRKALVQSKRRLNSLLKLR
jgi:putative aminopeptidase FrvX